MTQHRSSQPLVDGPGEVWLLHSNDCLELMIFSLQLSEHWNPFSFLQSSERGQSEHFTETPYHLQHNIHVALSRPNDNLVATVAVKYVSQAYFLAGS